MTRKERFLTYCLIAETIIVFLTAFILWVRTTVDLPDPWKNMCTVEEWMELLKEREHQPTAVWKGIRVGSITEKSTGISGPGLGFKGAPAGLLKWQSYKLQEQNPLIFMHLLESDDPQLILTGLYVYQNLSAEDLSAAQITKMEVAYRKLLDQEDSRMRWAAIRKLGNLRRLSTDDVERGLNDEVLDVAWIASFYLNTVLKNQTLYDSEDKLIEGDPNDVQQYVDAKRRLAPTLIKHLNHTHFKIRSACAGSLPQLFTKREKRTDGGTRKRLYDVTFPPLIDWIRSDWDTREQSKQLWEQWWAEHGEEALKFAHPPQD